MNDNQIEPENYVDGVPETKPTDSEAFDPPEGWVNFWDMNPVEHGGKFIKWDGDGGYWRIIEVTPPSAWPEPEHIVERYTVYPDNVWKDPDDPLTAFTDDMESILESLQDGHHLPNAPPYLENVTYYVADLTHYIHGRGNETFEIEEDDVEGYWANVPEVDPSNVEGVSDSDLPDE